MRVAIMQPTYLPWTGYFGMIHNVDVFVFYDDVQFVRRSWHHRNRIKNINTGKAICLTVPIKHSGNRDIKINESYIDNSTKWDYKHKKTIYHNYCKARFFEKYWYDLESKYKINNINLADFNICLIKSISDALNIKVPKFIKSSKLKDIEGKKTDRLITILNKLNATEYLNPIGAEGYIDKNKFFDKNIKLLRYDFKHLNYLQVGLDFIECLSAIDLLFNIGDESVDFIEKCLKDSIKEII